MSKVRISFDGKEYLHIINASGTYELENNMAFRTVSVSAVNSVPFKDFLLEMRTKNRMLASVFIENKLYLQGFVMYGDIGFTKSDAGFNVNFPVNDRFYSLKESDIIKTRDGGTLQQYMGNVLSELKFDDPQFINTYPRKISKASDFIVNGEGVKAQTIKTFKRSELAEKNAQSLISQSLTYGKNIIISNGSDTLSIEKTDLDRTPVFRIYADKDSNITNYEKVSNEDKKPAPAVLIVLNSGSNEEGKKIQDTNTGMLLKYKKGRPNQQTIYRTNTATTIQNIYRNRAFYLAGINSKANTFNFNVPNVIFDNNGNFFQPNRTIRVYIEEIGLDEDMKIVSVNFDISSSGTNMSFNLTSKEALNEDKNTNHKKALIK